VTSVSPLRVPILMYHEIADSSKTKSRLAVSPDTFAAQLAYLRDQGFTTITAGAMSAILAGEADGLPDRPIVLTFDDGYADFHTQALPLMEQYGFTATVFVTTGWTQEAGQGRMLSWSQLAAAARAGIEVGAHTIQHPQLDQLPEKRLHEELYACKQQLEDKLGFPVPGLAYPYGYSNAKVRQVAREAGYGYAYAVENLTASPASDLFALPRLTIRRATTMPEFHRLVVGHPTMRLLEDRALTKGWAVVRRTRAALNGASRGS
jgi:peptidoglycan/xylan/chitin deacetylase (PgdA/CDA1 family)